MVGAKAMRKFSALVICIAIFSTGRSKHSSILKLFEVLGLEVGPETAFFDLVGHSHLIV